MHEHTNQDALSLLANDHQKVQKAFEEFNELDADAYDEKRKLADKICKELEQHTQIEEEIFYPAFREAASDREAKPLVNEAEVEHDTAKNLIKQIKQMDSREELFDAKVRVLGEYVQHHVKEEEEEIFPSLKETDVNLQRLGREMKSRRESLS